MIPVVEKTVVRHLENATDVGWLPFVQEKISLGCVAEFAVHSLEEAQGDEGVEEIARGTGM